MFGFLKVTAFGTYTKIITFEDKRISMTMIDMILLNNLAPTKSLVKKLYGDVLGAANGSGLNHISIMI